MTTNYSKVVINPLLLVDIYLGSFQFYPEYLRGQFLGPTLFVLFLIDIVSVISPDTNILMYADDIKIWRQINCVFDHITLQKDIDSLIDWATLNKMKFHPYKTKVLKSI